MSIVLAFKHDHGRDPAMVIARVTGAPIHVAVFFGDVCIEATRHGVRETTKAARLATGQWTMVPMDVSPANAEKALIWARAQVGKRYDWLGVLWAWWGGRIAGSGHKDKWFCSELAAAILMRASVRLAIIRTAAYTPRRLFDTVQRREDRWFWD